MSTGQNPVNEFVHRVMNNEQLLNHFRANPETTLKQSDIEFTDDQRMALLSNKASKIREYLGEAQAHLVAVVVVVKRSDS